LISNCYSAVARTPERDKSTVAISKWRWRRDPVMSPVQAILQLSWCAGW